MKSLTVTLVVVLTITVCLAESEYEYEERGSGIYGKVIQKGKYIFKYMEQEVNPVNASLFFKSIFYTLLKKEVHM